MYLEQNEVFTPHHRYVACALATALAVPLLAENNGTRIDRSVRELEGVALNRLADEATVALGDGLSTTWRLPSESLAARR